jgi:hypothetical protein
VTTVDPTDDLWNDWDETGPAADDIPDAVDWPEPAEFVASLADLDPDTKLTRINDLTRWLAGQDDFTQIRYRRTVVDDGKQLPAGQWNTLLGSHKKKARPSGAPPRQERPDDEPDRYRVRDGHTYVVDDEGDERLLAKFVPCVVAEVTRDDGTEVTNLFRIRVTLPTGRSAEVDVPAEQFANAREWSARAVGASAVILPMSRDGAHVATAAQYIGNYEWTSETVYSHTGWRSDIPGGHRFLTASGALGAAGLDAGVTVDLGDERLNFFHLADPTAVPAAELAAAVRASLDLRHAAPGKVTVPMLAAAYRAPLPLQPETGVFVVGPSGSMKTALSAVVAQHFGRRFSGRALPAEWKSTGNSLEALAYQLANVLFVVDDYAPQAADDPRKLAQTADRLFRGAANGSGRGRLNRDGTQRPAKPPRSQVMATGEDVPPGESLRGRLITITVEPGAIDTARLTTAQTLGAEGTFELAMAGYIRWLAQQMDKHPDYAQQTAQQITARRAELSAHGGHSRVPEAVAGLLVAWRKFLEYAVAVGALTAAEARKVMAEVTAAMDEGAREQASHTNSMKVGEIYIEALANALAGGNAHLADRETGREPRHTDAARWGWEPYVSGDRPAEYHPRGTRIGWLDRDGSIYLDPGPAFEVARAHAGKSALPLNTTRVTIHRRLAEEARLASVDTKAGQLTVLRRMEGVRKRVLHVHAHLITGEEVEAA